MGGHLAEVMLKSGSTIRNPRPFCYRIAKNYCLNKLIHEGVEGAYQEKFIAEHTSRRRASSSGVTVIASSPVPTPYDELQETLLLEAAQRVCARFPEDAEILFLWREGFSVQEIVKKTKRSTATVYRKQKALLRALANEIGIEVPEEKDGN
jgi:DNA-directed RNA polymerase specialized sigma24 family protein